MGKMGDLFDIFCLFVVFALKVLFLCLCFVLCQCSVHVMAEVGVGKSAEIAEKGGERKVKVSESV